MKVKAKAIEAKGDIHFTNRIEVGDWVVGYHCKIEGKHYIIIEDAEFESYKEFYDGETSYEGDCIRDFIAINPRTIRKV